MQHYSDPDLLAMRRRKFPLPWVLVVLLLIAAVTLAGGFYLPLYKGHQRLASEHEALAKNARSVADELTRTQGELQRVEQDRSKLAMAVAASDDREKGASQRATELGQKLEGALDKRIKQRWAKVATTVNTVLLRIPSSVLFAANSLNLTRHGALLLCEAAGAMAPGEGAIHVAAHTASDEVAAALAKTYKTAWDLSAAQAAAAASALATQCAVAAPRITAAAHANTQPIEDATPAENARVELWVEL